MPDQGLPYAMDNTSQTIIPWTRMIDRNVEGTDNMASIARLGAIFMMIAVVSYAWQKSATSSGRNMSSPPMASYWIPWVGHAISWQRDSHALLQKLLKKYGHAKPIGIKLGPIEAFVLGDPELVNTMMKHNTGLSDVDAVCFTLTTILGARYSVVQTMYEDDNSGPGVKPYPGSTVPPERRARHLQTKTAKDHIAGLSGVKLGNQYSTELRKNLRQDGYLKQEKWDDLMDLVYDLVFPAATEVFFGKRMLELNPSLQSEVRGFLDDLPVYLRMLPRWVAPATYRRRDAALRSIKKWLLEIEERGISTSDWNSQYGCEYVKVRHGWTRNFEEVDINSDASEILGLFMAATANSIGAAYWTIYEVFSRPDLLERIRPVCESAIDPVKGEIDSVQLSRTPLLQSVLAEVLRMRVQGIVMRRASDPLEMNGWHFPKGAYIMAPSNFNTMNEKVWNTGGPGSPHPVDTFWAERFLIYPDNPSSGPVRRDESSKPQVNQDDGSANTVRYSEQGLKGAYFPFGGSLHPCPGRQFTQLEVLNTLAVLVLDYDLELQVESGWTPKMKTSHYGLGTLPPAEKVPCRIRRKQRS